MERVLGPASNTAVRAGLLFAGLSLVVCLGAAFPLAQTSHWATGVGEPLSQPVPFSHAHHVEGLGIDCRYCHTSYEESAFAGMPTSETCMHCHSELYTTAELLEPIRESWRSGVAVSWRRVHDLPDFVYFDHAAHVSAGVSCMTCHGDVGRMPLTWKAEPIDMAWCLDCHREPHATMVAADPDGDSGAGASREIDTALLTDCTACHR